MQPITIVTTAGRPDNQSLQLAQIACDVLGSSFEPRLKRSIAKMQQQFNANIVVAGKNRYEYYPMGSKNPFFFHPNSAAYRLKRIAKGEKDPFLTVCQLSKGQSFLDCTLGMGSDAIVASFAVGEEGDVVGLEVDPYVAFLVKKGMESYDTSDQLLRNSMRNIEVIQSNAMTFLQKQKDNAFDVIYLDPMFDEVIEESTNFEALRFAGNHMALSEEWVKEAIRVAKKRVVLKAHFRSNLFELFHFERKRRLTSKFHYGVIEKENYCKSYKEYLQNPKKT